ncbi:hypothetical protein [Stenotrophomonas sp.]|uniref:hypothetical protein n=1 Tax=Stenotrophomonas sp. TaxID=69392 RepID=UPI0028ADAB4E|nr:hypothetical protein [Stenotrophomonas sp.]
MADPQVFALQLQEMIARAKAKPGEVVRKTCIDLLTNVVMRTPVGNPDTWAINKTARDYNDAVNAWNAELRLDAANTDKRGRLKRGKRLNDGMDIIVPEGYVGGRLRANWFVSVGVQNRATTAARDQDGATTINRGVATISSADVMREVYITNSLPYAIPIEYGHSRGQAPQGMVRVTVTEFQTYIQKAIAEVSSE